MIDPLKLIFLDLTESGTEKKISVRGDLIGVIKDNTRGHTDVYVDMDLEGIKILQVLETREDIIDVLNRAYLSTKKGL